MHLETPSLITTLRERERDSHYTFSSYLRADQMCRESFLGTEKCEGISGCPGSSADSDKLEL